jgi:hypothetical protein
MGIFCLLPPYLIITVVVDRGIVLLKGYIHAGYDFKTITPLQVARFDLSKRCMLAFLFSLEMLLSHRKPVCHKSVMWESDVYIFIIFCLSLTTFILNLW